ncbi:DNA primase family protein [Desulfobacula toluolica]|uniref:Putative DNA-primase, phage/plasmid primase n=1 Tax=Desulfobacula toluolica (strain DSM 7467 / Tol2) TaxID=651182 RepID=K0NMV9_DESTT|nr:DNA primase family protein [Desulfobacula toluolica]CCK80032.1 putative DNA-primase, phage/plasmid primase [Desulfobacula toluolica Tol2]
MPKPINSDFSTGELFSEKDIWEALESNQDGDTKLFIKLNKGRFCYDHSDKTWFKFNGNFWEIDKVQEVYDGFGKLIYAYGRLATKYSIQSVEATKDGDDEASKTFGGYSKYIKKRISALHTMYRKKAVLQLASSGKNSLGISGDEWNNASNLFPCANGIINLKTGKLTQGMPGQYIKSASPIIYSANSPSPLTFLNFLKGVFNGNQDIIDYIQRLFGYSLLGTSREHIFVIMCGNGRNGKTTLLQIMYHILGPLGGPVKSGLLLDQGRTISSSSPNPDILDLKGKRLIWCSETNKQNKLDTGVVKWLTGGDELVGRPMYGKSERRFPPSHTLLLITNHEPKIPGGEDEFAFWKRVHLVPFNVSFVENPKGLSQCEIDKDLPDKLKEEAEGILSWLVQGCLEYQRITLKPPKEVLLATAEYKKQSDPIRLFIDEACIEKDGQQIKSSNLYEAYKDWCRDSGYDALGLKSFGAEIRKKFKVKRSNGIYYLGIGLKQDYSYYLE